MKKLFLYVLLACLLAVISPQVQAQAQVLNGDFEHINADGSLQNWGNVYIFSVVIDSLGQSSLDSIVIDNGYFYKPTTDAHSGAHAMLLSNGYNYTTNQGIAGSASADEDSVYTAWGSLEFIPCQTHVQNLRFYYKFLPVNNDSAVVTLTLYDSWGNPYGVAKKIFSDAQSTYTLVDIPVHYYTPNMFDIVAYSLNFSAFYSEDPWQTHQASLGTRLWIDDVSFTQTTNVQELVNDDVLQIYPNPAQNRFGISTSEKIKNLTCHDALGREIALDYRNLEAIPCGHLAKGIYLLSIETEKGNISEKLVVE